MGEAVDIDHAGVERGLAAPVEPDAVLAAEAEELRARAGASTATGSRRAPRRRGRRACPAPLPSGQEVGVALSAGERLLGEVRILDRALAGSLARVRLHELVVLVEAHELAVG